jgi:hypothetical protein
MQFTIPPEFKTSSQIISLSSKTFKSHEVKEIVAPSEVYRVPYFGWHFNSIRLHKNLKQKTTKFKQSFCRSSSENQPPMSTKSNSQNHFSPVHPKRVI